jgi:hypothetical protein
MFSIKIHVEYLCIIISKRKIRFKHIPFYNENKSPQKEVQQTTETLENVLRYAQHNFRVMNQPLSQTFSVSLCLCYVHRLYIAR